MFGRDSVSTITAKLKPTGMWKVRITEYPCAMNKALVCVYVCMYFAYSFHRKKLPVIISTALWRTHGHAWPFQKDTFPLQTNLFFVHHPSDYHVFRVSPQSSGLPIWVMSMPSPKNNTQYSHVQSDEDITWLRGWHDPLGKTTFLFFTNRGCST